MQTTHRIIYGDSRKLGALPDGSVELVVTSPPYPMIEMWDELFARLNPEVGLYLEQGYARKAFESMHLALDDVWAELHRVMKEGAIACINTGDAVRTVKDRFQLFANHSRIQDKFVGLGFDLLPAILWRKQTNAPNKFMGSGMLPAGAYVTLEHEYILIFRKGGKRVFSTPKEKKTRRQSSYFWEERNRWFSDLWDFKGTGQGMGGSNLRKRSAAYPLLLPFRLINMYSLMGDTVLDPFLGTATTMLAAMACGRNSMGCEIDSAFGDYIRRRLKREKDSLSHYNLQRLKDHLEFIGKRTLEKGPLKYVNSYFGFPVMTGQERELKLPLVKSLRESGPDIFETDYFDDDYVRELNLGAITLQQLQASSGGVQQRINFRDSSTYVSLPGEEGG